MGSNGKRIKAMKSYMRSSKVIPCLVCLRGKKVADSKVSEGKNGRIRGQRNDRSENNRSYRDFRSDCGDSGEVIRGFLAEECNDLIYVLRGLLQLLC